MNYVKFIKGTTAQYLANASYATDGSIFFATDSNIIYTGGVAYGLSVADRTLLNNSIAGVAIAAVQEGEDVLALDITYTDGTKTHGTVTLPVVSSSRNGLMTPQQLAALNAASTKVIKVAAATASELEDLGTNVKEAYKLIDENGDNIANSEFIKVYKDSSLLDVKLLHATSTLKPTYSSDSLVDIDSDYRTEANLALAFAYQLVDGSIAVETIAVGNFLRESEFGDGLQVNSGNVSVKVDVSSEEFLSVGENGIKISGIASAIETALTNYINSLTINGVAAIVSNHAASVTIDADDLLIDADSIANDTINAGGNITNGNSVKDAITTLEAMLLWYDAPDAFN